MPPAKVPLTPLWVFDVLDAFRAVVPVEPVCPVVPEALDAEWCRELPVLLDPWPDELPWDERARAAGLAENAAYLVRPDAYVGLALPDQDVDRLRAFLGALDLLHVR